MNTDIQGYLIFRLLSDFKASGYSIPFRVVETSISSALSDIAIETLISGAIDLPDGSFLRRRNGFVHAQRDDLLDALQCMLYFFEGFADAHGFTAEAIAEMEPIVQARAAIARAEGK